MRYYLLFTWIFFSSLTLFAAEEEMTKPQAADSPTELQNKSYVVAVPLALFVGFGSGHFYAKDTWGGIRYIAYDVTGVGLGLLSLYLDDFSNRSILFFIAIMAVNRIYQTVSAAESVYYYNKNPLLRDLDVFKQERSEGFLYLVEDSNVLRLEILKF